MPRRPVGGPAAHPFWEFSLALYARPGVEPACLGLQDRRGLDVNLLLFACWAAWCGHGRIGGEDWLRLAAASAAWRAEVVEPLRAVRRRMKGAVWPGIPGAAAESLRRQVKELELTAERTQQIALASIVPLQPRDSRGDVHAAVRANFEGLVAAAGVEIGGDDRADLARLAQAACEMADAEPSHVRPERKI